MNSGPREWDAKTYDQISEPQFQWGLEVLDRLDPVDGESVIDAGIGSGRVAEKLLERLPGGRLIGVDGSSEMIKVAAERFDGDERVTLFVSDLLDLSPELLAEHNAPVPVDALLSTATFHWILDHDRLFERIHSVLRPGGRLVAQCGGAGNIADHARAIVTVATSLKYVTHFEGMEMMWNFARPEETEERLRRAGFEDVRCWLEDKPVQPTDPFDFTTTVTMGPHLTRLPEKDRKAFAEAVLDLSEDPLILNYVRLNIDARRA
jgi:trans-aconitate 2-methyltransferase